MRLAFVDNQFGAGAAGALSFNVMAAVAQYYSDSLRSKVLKGMDERVRHGWPAGHAPFGDTAFNASVFSSLTAQSTRRSDALDDRLLGDKVPMTTLSLSVCDNLVLVGVIEFDDVKGKGSLVLPARMVFVAIEDSLVPFEILHPLF